MKLFGHPIHLMLLHFPAAIIPLELIAYMIYFIKSDEMFAITSFHLLIAGSVLGWFAALAGLADLIRLQTRSSAALGPAMLHGTLNIFVLFVFSLMAFRAWKVQPEVQAASLTWSIVRILNNAILVIGNYLGGRLILKHRIAVEP